MPNCQHIHGTEERQKNNRRKREDNWTIQPAKVSGKRQVLRTFWKDRTPSEFLMRMGRLFHSQGAATEKARSPTSLFVLWTARDFP